MSFTTLDQSSVIVNKLDIANTQLTISTTAQANASGVWVFIANSTTGGTIFKPDTSSNSASNISASSAFRQISNYFYGVNSFIPDSYNNTIQRTTVRVIQIGRPILDEGLYKNSVTASFSANLFSLTAHDIVDVNSEGSALGLTGSFVNVSNSGDKIGTVFYDHGVIVLHGGSGSSSALISSASGFTISNTYAASEIRLTQFKFQTRNVLKRSIFFCRAFNYQYNYTTNPTARNTDGTIINSLSSNPATFITTVGLYNDNGELLAVGKLSTPQKKSFSDESTISVALDI